MDEFGGKKTKMTRIADHLRKPINWQQSFAAMKYPNYRLWFWSQMMSLFGTWMQMTAQGYFVFHLTHSPAYLGYLAFASGIPTWLFMMYAGVIADRISRRDLMIITQTGMMVLAFIQAALTFTGVIRPWQIVILAFCLGIANAFDAPARQSFAFDMVDKEDLMNAIAMNSAMFNSAMAIGPAISGVTYALFGPAWCFTINGLSFLVVIRALYVMKLPRITAKTQGKSAISDLREGFRYVVSHPTIRMIIGLMAVMSIFGFSFMTLLPAWAVKVLGGDETVNGLLQSSRGIGALIGAFVIASLGRFQFKGRLLTLGTFAFPIGLLLFAAMRAIPFSLLMLMGVGMANILIMNMANALVQVTVEDRLRGRVMGIYTFIFFGFMPIGGLGAGAVAENLGAPVTLTMGALICLGVAAITWIFFPQLRQLK